MPEPSCETCKFREKYDNNPSSFLGKLWRWHINWCPGWKSYMESVSDEKRGQLVDKYKIKKYQKN